MSRDFRFACNDGVLSIVSSSREMQIRWQPLPLAREKDGRGIWHKFAPDFRLVVPAPLLESREGGERFAEDKKEAFREFRRTIPQAFARIAEPFPSHQWNLLRAVQEESGMRELAESNPALAYALANSHELRDTNADAAVVQATIHCRHKRRNILRWLGFPGTPAMVRFFARMPAAAASPRELTRLRHALTRSPDLVQRLAGYPRIHAGILGFVDDPYLFPFASPGLLAEISRSDGEIQEARTAGLLLDTLCMAGDLGLPAPAGPFASVEAIRRFHEATTRRYVRRQRPRRRERRAIEEIRPVAEIREAEARIREAKARSGPFPPPPIPGTAEIVPITTAAGLAEEGRRQHNCVGSYAPRVRGGRSYVYRVLAPERATLEIVRGSDGCWWRGQLQRSCNRDVSPATEDAVDAWLNRYSPSV